MCNCCCSRCYCHLFLCCSLQLSLTFICVSFLEMIFWTAQYTHHHSNKSMGMTTRMWQLNQRKMENSFVSSWTFSHFIFFHQSFSVLIFNAYTEDALVKMKRNMTKKNEQTLLEESVCRMFDGKWGNCRNENLCMSAFYVPPHRCRSNEKRSHWMVVIVVGVVFLSLLLVVIIFELHAASYYIIFGIY